MISKQTSLEELAYIVCSELQRHGVEAVLTGGAAVSIYTKNRYQSFDLDFVTFASIQQITEAMMSIGFKRKNRYYTHPDTEFFVEFPPGPLSLGFEPVKDWAVLDSPIGQLFVLTPTQSVKDRLAAYYHWNDLQSLDQAIWITLAQEVDLIDIEAWSIKEKSFEKFQKFIAELDKQKS